MRETLYSLGKSIRKKLKQYEEIQPYINTLISVELMAVAFDKLKIKVPLNEAWTLLTGYNEPILPKSLSREIIYKLRMLMPTYSAESGWLDALETYKRIDIRHRLICINEEGNFSIKTPTIDPGRKRIYENILNNQIPYKKSDKKFAKAGDFFYTKPGRDLNLTMTGTIPKEWITDIERLPEYRTKKKLSFSLDFDWLKIASEIDGKLGGNRWKNTVKPITLRSISGEKDFHYEGLQHIVGGLAAGKSTFQWINTYWLVKHKGARVGLIVNSVSDLLEVVNELLKLGINVAPIIGKSSRRRHLKNEMYRGEYFTFDTLRDSTLKSLSGICPLKSLAGDFKEEGEPYYPCEWIYSRYQTAKLCPLVHMCGIYEDWTKLTNAEVWVTTSAAVLNTKIPAMIDPYKRTLYEAMYDLLDVIFVDEADQVQQRFEEQFIEEIDAFGKPNYFVGRLEKHYFEEIRPREQFIGNPVIEEWHSNLNHLSENSNLLMGILKNSRKIRNLFKNNVIYLNFFIHHLTSKIAENETHHEQLRSRLIKYSQSVYFGSSRVTEGDLHSIVREGSDKESTNIIKAWLVEAGVVIPEEANKFNLLIVEMKVFVYLANIEAALKYVKYNYPFVRQHTKLEQFSLLSINSDFRPITKEAMSGVMFGYRYNQQSGEHLGSIEIIQYLAIGKDLLFKWPTIFEGVDHRKGPSVILLSGTSYAPKSLHYHIEYEPTWFISSTRQTSKLEQSFLPVRNPNENEEVLKISGVMDEGRRKRYLRTMVVELQRKIEDELTYWRAKGKNRKVLLVVNSYDDVPIVGEALEATGKFSGRYRLLSRGDRKDERYFPRTLIEVFPEEGADILVVPLMSISRGYNIMKDNQAYFGSAFFLIRPYPVPNDLRYFIQVLHGSLPLYFSEITEEELSFVKAMRYLRKKGRGRFEEMYRRPDFWLNLEEEEREVLAWYTLIPVWQLIGRLLRHGSNARVFYCDGQFGIPSAGNKALLDYWQKVMSEMDDAVFDNLYGPFKESIRKVKGEVTNYE